MEMKKGFATLAFCLLSGCSTNHFSEAILYQKKPGTAATFESIQDGNNPVYVSSDSIFSIGIEHIQPGWIHNGETQPTLNDSKYRGFKKGITSHLMGKELWLLTKIESLNNEDILERNIKTYYKTTNVKLNSESFSRIALDVSEKDVFTHGADSQYRVTFKLYEVDAFDLKKASAMAYDKSPGIAGVLLTAGQAITSTLGAVTGSIVTDLWSSARKEQLFIERLLLENDATLEFQGSIILLRKDDVLSAKSPIKSQEYILYDKFKSEDWNTVYSNKETYIERRKERLNDIDIAAVTDGSIDRKSYIKIKVTQALSRQAATRMSIATLVPAHEAFLNSVRID